MQVSSFDGGFLGWGWEFPVDLRDFNERDMDVALLGARLAQHLVSFARQCYGGFLAIALAKYGVAAVERGSNLEVVFFSHRIGELGR